MGRKIQRSNNVPIPIKPNVVTRSRVQHHQQSAAISPSSEIGVTSSRIHPELRSNHQFTSIELPRDSTSSIPFSPIHGTAAGSLDIDDIKLDLKENDSENVLVLMPRLRPRPSKRTKLFHIQEDEANLESVQEEKESEDESEEESDFEIICTRSKRKRKKGEKKFEEGNNKEVELKEIIAKTTTTSRSKKMKAEAASQTEIEKAKLFFQEIEEEQLMVEYI